jgi:hypothetical protein
MLNPYEPPQSDISVTVPVATAQTQRVSEAPSWRLIIGLSLLALIPPGFLFCGAIHGIYAMHFDPSLIPKNASAPGYHASYILLPLTGLWIVAHLRFLFSRGRRAAKGLAIVYMVFAGMMLMAIVEGLADWLGLIERSPDSPPRTENSLGLFNLIFEGLLVYFSLLAFGHSHVRKQYQRSTPETKE